MRSPIEATDDALGHMVEQLSTSHHRRRLRHVGWAAAIDPPEGGWAEAAPPARRGNALEVLIDGAHALQAIAVAIAAARSHVHIAGWHLTPDFALTRHETPTIVRELLADVAARLPVRVLIWAGAPLPVLRPWRG
ncbi:MAG: phospholipase, partial [Chloroflexi bacterium]